MKKIIAFYKNYDEDSRLVNARARAAEYLTTVEILKQYVDGAQSLLDVGAGTGRYALHYAAQGLKVSALELVPEYAEIIRRKAREAGADGLQVVVGNACDLGQWSENTFDTVLCLGPLYHLRSRQERNACLAECIRVLRPGGIAAFAYINQWFALAYYCQHRVHVPPAVMESILADDYDFQSDVDAFLDISHFTTPSRIEQEIQPYPVAILEHVGADGIYALFGDAVEQMSEAEWQPWLAYHLKTCRERDTLGYSNHGLVVCKKG